jgi:exopolyphosphatase/guanosine-5'-triphosphate,3'-diphosphate pyrophosphatase
MNGQSKDVILKILAEKEVDTKHPLHVTWLSERLFDELKCLHHLGDKEKEYLISAAMLHDMGLLISVKGHHRHSGEIILNSEISDKDLRGKQIIANIARYHRKSLPSLKHEIYRHLPEDDKKIVSKLAAILRIADGLDRTHLSLIRDIKVNIDDSYTRIKYISERRFLPEEEAAIKKSDLFGWVFKRKVIVVWERV